MVALGRIFILHVSCRIFDKKYIYRVGAASWRCAEVGVAVGCNIRKAVIYTAAGQEMGVGREPLDGGRLCWVRVILAARMADLWVRGVYMLGIQYEGYEDSPAPSKKSG